MMRRILSSDEGTTMIEVLVAIIIVVLMTTMFAGTVNKAVSILNKSRNNITAMEKASQQFYTRDRKNDITVSNQLKLLGNGSEIILKQSKLKKFSTDGFTRYYISANETKAGGENSGSN